METVFCVFVHVCIVSMCMHIDRETTSNFSVVSQFEFDKAVFHSLNDSAPSPNNCQ